MRDQTGDTIDLHGLFASEAIDVVKITMDEAKPGHTLNFITGKGLNSDKLKGCFSIEVPLEAPPISEDQRLAVGDFIPKEESAAITLISHYAVVFIDPRRSSAQTVEVINEFKGIHCDALGTTSNKISLNIITSDDTNDLRKLVKKRRIDWCVILSDSEKKLAEAVGCYGVDRLLSVLMVLDAVTGCVVGIWYEGCEEWETDVTGDLVMETIQQHQQLLLEEK
eukprot:gene33591-43413_t